MGGEARELTELPERLRKLAGFKKKGGDKNPSQRKSSSHTEKQTWKYSVTMATEMVACTTSLIDCWILWLAWLPCCQWKLDVAATAGATEHCICTLFILMPRGLESRAG